MNALLNVALAPQAPAADTVVTVAARDGFDLLVAIAAGLIALTFLAILLLMLYAFVRFHRVSRALDRARERLSADPGVEALRETAKNVEAISDSLKGEVAKLTASISGLSDRLTQASDRMEERIEEFNALMEVVQAEAEEVFVDTASTARGVKRGVAEFGASGRRPRRGATYAGPEERAPSDSHPDDLTYDPDD